MRVSINDSTLTSIANAIRSKLGVDTEYKPSQMPAAINSIDTGYPEPTGTITITQNGTKNVKDYATAVVNVDTPVIPSASGISF